MPSRPVVAACAAAVALLVGGCDDGTDGAASTGDRRAEQAREAAVEAGLDAEVADFVALLARGDTATYRVRFPGPAEGSELLVRNRPPDRRVDVEVDGEVVEVRQVVDGEAFTCTPQQEGGFACERTDALVEPPGVFGSGALARFAEGLASRRDDFTFAVEDRTVAGVDARCLVTRLRPGRDDPQLGEQGTICASPQGAVLLVDQAGERVEAVAYGTDVDPDALTRVDRGR